MEKEIKIQTISGSEDVNDLDIISLEFIEDGKVNKFISKDFDLEKAMEDNEVKFNILVPMVMEFYESDSEIKDEINSRNLFSILNNKGFISPKDIAINFFSKEDVKCVLKKYGKPRASLSGELAGFKLRKDLKK